MGNAIYKTAALNEWQIVIKGGELKKAGIGMKTFINPFTESVAKFSSSVTKVHFRAEQVTKEMQGIEISGVVMWSVKRDEDGPFRFYKYAGQDITAACDNLRMVTESIVRNAVANSTISEVMSQRDIMRNMLKKGIMDAVQGWGMWVETVELTDVKICSKQLFEDLQAEFRNSAHLNAQRLKMQTTQKVTEERLASDQIIAEQRLKSDQLIAEKKAQTKADTQLFESRTKLRQEEENAKLFAKQMEMARAKLEQEKAMKLDSLKMREELERKEIALRIELDKIKSDAALREMCDKFEAESKIGDSSMKLATLDATKDIYRTLKLSNINLHNYVGTGAGVNGDIGVEQILPALGSFTEACQTVADKK